MTKIYNPAEVDEECKLLENLIDVATAAVKRGDGDGALKAIRAATESARRLPKKEIKR